MVSVSWHARVEVPCLPYRACVGYKNMKSGFFIAIISSFFCYMVVGLIMGFLVSMDERVQGKDGCSYQSYLPYTNPGYLAACELTRIRFNNEQPVRLVPSETKEIK
jgi:hypothetical protein